MEQAFSTKDLPRNYIWTLGYLGEWHSAEAAEVNAQVKSYSRAWIVERAEQLERKRAEMDNKKQQLQKLRMEALDNKRKLAEDTMKDADAIKQRIAAGPLAMAKGLVESATQLATGGTTDPTERMEICKSCPFMGEDKRCGRCGCFLPAKTRVAKSTCPIGSW